LRIRRKTWTVKKGKKTTGFETMPGKKVTKPAHLRGHSMGIGKLEKTFVQNSIDEKRKRLGKNVKRSDRTAGSQRLILLCQPSLSRIEKGAREGKVEERTAEFWSEKETNRKG